MTHLPTEFTETLTPIAPERVGEAGAAAIERLAEAGYEVRTGLTPDFAKAIITMALEPGIREYCPNDAGSRFKDLAALEEWLSKGREVFLLLARTESSGLRLAGYGWIGRKAESRVPGSETTFAVRIGESDQGRGLATPYVRLMVAGAAGLYGLKNLWLEAWKSNSGAVHVYGKVGFELVAEVPDERPTASGGTVPDSRLFMSLPNRLLP